MDHALRRRHCKHILMILLKVYRVPFNSPLFHSLNTTRQERYEARTFSRAIDPSVLVPEEVKQKVLQIGYQNHPDAAPVVEEITIAR